MAIVKSDLAKSLWPGLEKIFKDEYEQMNRFVREYETHEEALEGARLMNLMLPENQQAFAVENGLWVADGFFRVTYKYNTGWIDWGGIYGSKGS